MTYFDQLACNLAFWVAQYTGLKSDLVGIAVCENHVLVDSAKLGAGAGQRDNLDRGKLRTF